MKNILVGALAPLREIFPTSEASAVLRNNDRLQEMIFSITYGYFINAALYMIGKTNDVGRKEIGVINEHLVNLFACKRVQVNREHTFFNIVQLQPKLFLGNEIRIDRNTLRTFYNLYGLGDGLGRPHRMTLIGSNQNRAFCRYVQ